jgi:hypothetical protein
MCGCNVFGFGTGMGYGGLFGTHPMDGAAGKVKTIPVVERLESSIGVRGTAGEGETEHWKRFD